jgi:hypothetical protein
MGIKSIEDYASTIATIREKPKEEYYLADGIIHPTVKTVNKNSQNLLD